MDELREEEIHVSHLVLVEISWIKVRRILFYAASTWNHQKSCLQIRTAILPGLGKEVCGRVGPWLASYIWR